jgi:cytidyltransferase-like protein
MAMDHESQKMFSHKIKTAAEIAKVIGDRPRSKKVIMCHGTFDVVHPGHVRHLLYAKTKAPLLIASLTADEHIKKGNLRPYVPENLRAVNLAALEMVDYVLVDAEKIAIDLYRKSDRGNWEIFNYQFLFI